MLSTIVSRLMRPLGVTLTTRPIAAILGLGVLPNFWIAGCDRIVSYAIGAANTQYRWTLMALLWSIILPGQITYALRLMRGQSAPGRLLLRLDSSVISATVISLSSTAIVHGLDAAGHALGLLHGWWLLVQIICWVFVCYVLYRTAAWLPLIVDRHFPMKSALLRAVDATRHRTSVFVAFGLILLAAAVPFGILLMLAAKNEGLLILIRIGMFTFGTLAGCRLYEYVIDGQGDVINHTDTPSN